MRGLSEISDRVGLAMSLDGDI